MVFRILVYSCTYYLVLVQCYIKNSLIAMKSCTWLLIFNIYITYTLTDCQDSLCIGGQEFVGQCFNENKFIPFQLPVLP